MSTMTLETEALQRFSKVVDDHLKFVTVAFRPSADNVFGSFEGK